VGTGYLVIQTLLPEAVSSWFTISSYIWLVLMLLSCVMVRKGNLVAIMSALFSTIALGRLYSTMRLGSPSGSSSAEDLLLFSETGPGVMSVTYTSLLLSILLIVLLCNVVLKERQRLSAETYVLGFIRVYVGLMFIPHFIGHIFASSIHFHNYAAYFMSIGLSSPALMVWLAGLIEVAVAIGLCFGFMTRIAAVGGCLYLFLTMLLGDHFSVGYIWILPNGGYEFGIFWAVMVGVFAFAGGGPLSVDKWLGNHFLKSRPFIIR
jgi:putative oxidoreductase